MQECLSYIFLYFILQQLFWGFALSGELRANEMWSH